MQKCCAWVTASHTEFQMGVTHRNNNFPRTTCYPILLTVQDMDMLAWILSVVSCCLISDVKLSGVETVFTACMVASSVLVFLLVALCAYCTNWASKTTQKHFFLNSLYGYYLANYFKQQNIWENWQGFVLVIWKQN